MLTIILFIIVGFIVGIIIDFNRFESNGGSIILGLLFGLIIGCSIACEKAGDVEYEKVVETQNLLAISDGSGISADLFLLSGTVGEEDYYKCYVEINDGVYRFKKFNAKWCNIKFTDEQPRIVRKKWRRLTEITDVGVWKIYEYEEDETKELYWNSPTIYIPEGGIVREYNLDLK